VKKKGLFNAREDGCWVCGNPEVQEHHVFYGVGRRKVSDAEGCVIYLCHFHHQDPRSGIHFDKDFDRAVKCQCQMKWEAREGLDEPDHATFIRRFGRNYIMEEQ
jgi:hypothetical protein